MRGLVLLVVVGCGGPPGPGGTLVATPLIPAELATDASSVYWTDSDDGVQKMPLGAVKTTPTTLVDRTATREPDAILVDSTSVYWGNSSDYSTTNGSIGKVALDGSSPTTLVSNIAGPFGLAFDATRVYWTDGGSVWAVPTAGGAVQRIAIAESDVYNIVVGTTHAYWTSEGGEVRSLDLTDLSAIPITIAKSSSAWQIAIDATHVYWISYDNNYVSVMAVPLQGGPSVTLDQLRPGNGFRISGGLAVDAEAVYWTTCCTVRRVNLDGTNAQTLADNNQDIESIVLSASDVYWSGGLAVTNAETAAIRRTAK